jgi:hypothetical protein
VALDTITVSVVELGPVMVMVSPLIAVTLPITLGGTISMLAAVVEPCAVGRMCTCSPTANALTVDAARSLVTVVDESIVYVLDVPEGSLTVMDVLETAVTVPPAPITHCAPGVVEVDES